MANNTKNTGDIDFRLATPSDAEVLVDLIRKYYEFDHIPFHETEIRAGLPPFLDDPSLGRAWMIFDDEQIVGYTIVTYGFDLELGGRLATITDLYFEPSHRGRGLGFLTLKYIEKVARRSGVLALELRVERNNPRAFALYQKFGFKTHDRIPMSKRIEAVQKTTTAEEEMENWNRYSPIWRNILTKVLEWEPETAEQFIENLRREKDKWEKEEHFSQFFFDLPSNYVFRPILGAGLQERTSETEDANPHRIYKILARAIAGGLEREMERNDFDWVKARQRYNRRRKWIEKWLATRRKINP